MFLVGEGIFYPMYGAGYVVNVEEKNVYNTIKRYYIIRLIIDGILVMIPMDAAESKGLRKVIEESEYEGLIKILGDNINVLPSKWAHRYITYNNCLRSGNIYNLAGMLRDIYNLPKRKEISKSDMKAFNEILSMIASEVSIVKHLEFELAKAEILKFLEK